MNRNVLIKKWLILGSVIVALSTYSSCVLQQGITLSTGTSGWATTDLYVYDFFLDVLEDFEPFIPDHQENSIMDASIIDFTHQLAQTDSASNISSMKIGDNGYFIDFTFTSLEGLLQDLNKREMQQIITITKENHRSVLQVRLDIDNYPQLTKIIPFLADPNFETFGPLYNQGMSEEEYLEMVEYILGSEAPGAIVESLISLRFTVPSIVLLQSGGVRESPNSVRFDIPLIEFLLLEKPIVFRIIW